MLDDQLKTVPGFSLFRRTSSRVANPTTQGLTMRGLSASGASRGLVLVDGIPLNDAFGGWLYRVAANSVVDHVRAGNRVVRMDDTSPAADEPSLDAFSASIERDELRAALYRLAEPHRRVLLLKFFDDLEIEEICAVLGCSRKTLAVKLHRAIAALRGVMLSEATDAA